MLAAQNDLILLAEICKQELKHFASIVLATKPRSLYRFLRNKAHT
jgi:hypothetical protein